MNDGQVHIGLVITGGTIGSTKSGDMVVIDLTSTTVFEANFVEDAWPGPGRLKVHMRIPFRKLSEDMRPQDWVTIAENVRELVEVEKVNSVLVFHGTDTAAYTATALSLLLADLDATVVVTGSNIPGDQPNTDAHTNVTDALLVARSMAPGVYLSFAGVADEPSEVHLGCAVRKMKGDGQAYGSPNFGPVARVENGEVEVLRSWPRRRREARSMKIDPNVSLFHLHPGIDLDMMAGALISSGKKGAVVRLYPCATSPAYEYASLPTFTKKCVAAGIVVVACMEQFSGSDAYYPSLVAIKEEGAVFAADMIPEVAFVKLSWAIAQTSTPVEAAQLFLKPISGESIPAALQEDRVDYVVPEDPKPSTIISFN